MRNVPFCADCNNIWFLCNMSDFNSQNETIKIILSVCSNSFEQYMYIYIYIYMFVNVLLYSFKALAIYINDYRRRKWNRCPEFKCWTWLFAFHLENTGILLFSPSNLFLNLVKATSLRERKPFLFFITTIHFLTNSVHFLIVVLSWSISST